VMGGVSALIKEYPTVVRAFPMHHFLERSEKVMLSRDWVLLL
jgi:hypothetical protein